MAYGNIASAEIFPSNINVFRNDRNSNGGVFIAVNQDIPSFERKDLANDDIESTWCQISITGQTALIGSFYRPPPPRGKCKRPIEKLGESLSKINSCTSSPHVILGGDFNVPGLTWSNEDATELKGNLQKSLMSFINDSHLSQMVTFPTRKTKMERRIHNTRLVAYNTQRPSHRGQVISWY